MSLVVCCLLFVCRGLAVFDACGSLRIVHCSVSIIVCCVGACCMLLLVVCRGVLLVD